MYGKCTLYAMLFAVGFLPVYKIANFSTTQGPDCYTYIQIADELESLSLPETHHPIGYPLLVLLERKMISAVTRDFDTLSLMILSSCVFSGLSAVFFFIATGFLLENFFTRVVVTLLFCYHPVVMFSSANAAALFVSYFGFRASYFRFIRVEVLELPFQFAD